MLMRIRSKNTVPSVRGATKSPFTSISSTTALSPLCASCNPTLKLSITKPGPIASAEAKPNSNSTRLAASAEDLPRSTILC